MYKSMLVPADGSKLAELAFSYAEELAARLDTKVTMLHVVDPRESETLPMHRAYVDRSSEIMRRRISEVQKKLGKKSGQESPQVSGDVVTGHAAEEILRYTREKGIDLIVMSTHGRTGIRHWVVGSVADKLLQTSAVPVLLVRSASVEKGGFEKWMNITVVVPLDGSALAESVLPHVQALAQQVGNYGLDVVLIRVCEPPPIPVVVETQTMPINYPVDYETLRNESWESCRQTTKQYLAGIENHLKQTGLRVRSEPIEETKFSVAEEIVDYANKMPFSLIVMATHGHSGARRWAYGSVAHKVLMGSSSPVLLVRTA